MINISNQPIIELTNPSLPGRTWHGSESVLTPVGGRTKIPHNRDSPVDWGDLRYLGDA